MELEKRINVNENRILIYKKEYVKPSHIRTITEYFLENGDLIKNYDLIQSDDYGLYGWSEEETSKLSFEFDINHPLYIPLFHLLNYDRELIIEDDDTREYNKKYMKIYKEQDKIYIDFIDDFENNYIGEKFNIFIKNTEFDLRSKIDQEYKDTKKRLALFFNEISNVLLNDYHQINIEEYMLENSNDNELQKVFKRKF